MFSYKLWVKGRWVNNKIIDVLSNEFCQYSKEYFKKAIEDLNILVNDEKTHPDYIIKKGDFLEHKTIRNENPIINTKLEILFEDNNFLVVDKPSSWPVHVCGGYQFNTLHRILMDEYDRKNIKILHRLDKHTSGIVVTAKNSITADKFRKAIDSLKVSKSYFARVKGNFPHDSITVIRAIVIENKSKGIHTDCEWVESLDGNKNYYAKDVDDDDKINNEKVIEENTELILNEKKKFKKDKKLKSLDGVKTFDEIQQDKIDPEENQPKYAKTIIEKVFYDENSNTSVVRAHPKTGRTHQIRIHLRYLGYPIANDPCYGGIVYNDLEEFDNPDMISKDFNNNSDVNKVLSVSEIYAYKIWLHAYRYEFEDYIFETKIPPWAQQNYIVNKKFE